MQSTVILVAHSAYANLLPTALKSLRQQTTTPSIIVVNNGRDAGVHKACQPFDEVTELGIPATTLAKAANQGAALVKTPYLMRLDADDWCDYSLVETLEAAIKGVDAAWSDYYQFVETRPGVEQLSHDPQPDMEHACGILMRTYVFRALGGYDESLRYQEAFDFWCRFRLEGYEAKKVEAPLYAYRQHAGSMSTNPERLKVRARLQEKYADYC